MAKVKAIVLASVMLFCLGSLLFAGSGTVTISSVQDNQDGSYTLTVNSTSDMTVGDHFGARLTTGAGAIYEITEVTNSTAVVVSDTLTEERGSPFGAPAIGAAWYGTPTTNDLSKPPYQAPGWDAALRRNAHLLDDSASIDLSNLTITGGTITGITDLAVADGGTGASDAAGARANLGLEIGSDVQAYDADLAALAAISGQQGDVIYHNGTSWVRLGAGTDGQVLTTGGAGANPVWGSAPGVTMVYSLSSPVVDDERFDVTIPAGTIVSDGDYLRVTVWGTADDGMATIAVPGAVITSASSSQGGYFRFDSVGVWTGQSSVQWNSMSTTISGSPTTVVEMDLAGSTTDRTSDFDLTIIRVGGTGNITVAALIIEVGRH